MLPETPAQQRPARDEDARVREIRAKIVNDISEDWRDPLHNAYLVDVPWLLDRLQQAEQRADRTRREAEAMLAEMGRQLAQERERADRAEQAHARCTNLTNAEAHRIFEEAKEQRERADELRKMIVDSATVCTLKGCEHCKWLGFNLGRYESLAASQPAAREGGEHE